MKPLTLTEAATFLRMSKSTLYQRKDIPRYRLPGSRTLLFDQHELELLVKQGRISDQGETEFEPLGIKGLPGCAERAGSAIDISSKRVYHRNLRYR